MENITDERTNDFVDVFRKFISITNNMCINEREISEALADEFMREHRTLQQSSIRILQGMLQNVAEKQTSFDLRNEAAFKWIKEVGKIECNGFPHV